MSEISVSVDVTAARRGSREAISIGWVAGGMFNPAEARAAAGDLEAAMRVVDHLCPPKPLEHGDDDEEPF